MFVFERTLLPHVPSVTEDGARLFSGRWERGMPGPQSACTEDDTRLLQQGSSCLGCIIFLPFPRLVRSMSGHKDFSFPFPRPSIRDGFSSGLNGFHEAPWGRVEYSCGWMCPTGFRCRAFRGLGEGWFDGM